MASRVYLHIGTMKSATTYLQHWGDVNRHALAEAGVLWPELGLPFAATSDLLARADARRPSQGAWRRLTSELERHDGAAVLSNELLAAMGQVRAARVIRALRPAEISIVLTVRDLARVLPSQWQTRLKNGSTVAWTEFAEAVCGDVGPTPGRDDREGADNEDAHLWFWRRQDWPAIVRRWRDAAETGIVTLVTVPPAGSPTAFTGQRFAAALGVNARGYVEPEYRNSSLGAHSAELVRRVNQAASGWDREYQRMGVRNGLARTVLAERARDEPGCALSPHLFERLRGRTSAMIADLEGLDVQIIGDLQDLVPTPETMDGVDPGQSSDSELLTAAVTGLVGFARVHTEVRTEYDRLADAHERLVTSPKGAAEQH